MQISDSNINLIKAYDGLFEQKTSGLDADWQHLFSVYILFCHSIYVERQPLPASSSSSTQGTLLQSHLKRKET